MKLLSSSPIVQRGKPQDVQQIESQGPEVMLWLKLVPDISLQLQNPSVARISVIIWDLLDFGILSAITGTCLNVCAFGNCILVQKSLQSRRPSEKRTERKPGQPGWQLVVAEQSKQCCQRTEWKGSWERLGVRWEQFYSLKCPLRWGWDCQFFRSVLFTAVSAVLWLWILEVDALTCPRNSKCV